MKRLASSVGIVKWENWMSRVALLHKRQWHGKTGIRTQSGRCSECGWSNFRYSNGNEWSRDGIRGFRCVGCGTVKPEQGWA